MPNATIYYKRSRFLAHLPEDPLYPKSHCWLAQSQPGDWRVGLTTFASRMLGDMVEFGFGVKAGDRSPSARPSAGWRASKRSATSTA